MGGQHGEGEDEISSIVEDARWLLEVILNIGLRPLVPINSYSETPAMLRTLIWIV